MEEKALKYSILGIVAQLQSVREAGKARRNDLLLAVLPQALPFLSTVGVFATVQTSTFVRACASAAENQFRLLVPHLDAAPQTPSSLQRFVKEVALSSVRSVSLPAAATWYLLAEHRVELSAVEVLKLPCGCVDFAGIPDLPSLQTLEVDALGADSATISRLTAALLGLHRPLRILRLKELAPELGLLLLDAIVPSGASQRLGFQRCVLPDAAVLRLCQALTSGSVAPQIIHFEECELSDRAEQHLLATLEQTEVRCTVTIDGGMSRMEQHLLNTSESCTGRCSVQEEQTKPSKIDQTTPPAAALPLQDMLVVGLMRLREEEAEYASRRPLQVSGADASQQGGLPVDMHVEKAGKMQSSSELSCDACEQLAARSRFGFALDDSDDE